MVMFIDFCCKDHIGNSILDTGNCVEKLEMIHIRNNIVSSRGCYFQE